MKSENKLMGLKAGIVSAVAILIFTAGVGASTAHAKVFHAWVEGLPSGVLVQFVGQWSCFLDNHNPMLTETQITRFEVAPNFFGQMVLQQVTRTVYVGQADKVLQNVNCGIEAGIALNQTDFDGQYIVWGRDGGNTRFKIAQQHYEVNPDPTVEEFLTITIEAKSTSLVIAGTSIVPTTVTRSIGIGSFQTWKATYSDSFGFQDIINPSLDFTQTSVNFLHQLVTESKIKMWLTPDNQVCLRVGDTVCKAKSEGGTLSNGGVTVSVADVVVEGSQIPGLGNGNTMTVTWRFRFSLIGTTKDPAPAAGDFTAVISADDRDLSDGYFTGAGFGSTPQPKNLLSWKPLGVAISVF